jgi:hypothetical protein
VSCAQRPGGARLSQPIAITAPKFCTIDRPFGTAFILRTVEFDVLTCNYERMNGKTKGVATGRCQGCNHPERARIERFLAAGASIKGAARKFAINYHALRRHWRNHVSAEARATYMAGAGASKDQLEEIVADESLGLLDHYRIIRGALYRSLSAAAELGDGNSLALLAGRLHENSGRFRGCRIWSRSAARGIKRGGIGAIPSSPLGGVGLKLVLALLASSDRSCRFRPA